MSPNEIHFLNHALLRLLVAAALGAAVGLERELKRKPAGLRTIILITFGSALFTMLSEALAAVRGGDPQRIAAQLIPGIGFLGAGAIIQARGTVVGLTTAATIFAMASVGMATGSGLIRLAVAATLFLLLFLVVLGWVEHYTEARLQVMSFSLTTKHADRCVFDVQQMARRHHLALRDLRVKKSDAQTVVEFSIEAPGGSESLVLESIDEIQHCHA